VEPRRVWTTEVLVPRCVGRREGRGGGLAPRKCDGAGSSGMDVADHGEGPVLGSILGLGRAFGIAMNGAADRSGRRCSALMKPDIVRAGQNDKLV
jgi:hypothetical protein